MALDDARSTGLPDFVAVEADLFFMAGVHVYCTPLSTADALVVSAGDPSGPTYSGLRKKGMLDKANVGVVKQLRRHLASHRWSSVRWFH